MKRLLHALMPVALGALACHTAQAVPARGLPQAMEQPDGTMVTVTLCGDEFFNWFLTEDGLVAARDSEGVLRLVGNDGRLTSIPVMNIAQRDASYAASISTLQPQTAFEAMRSEAEAQSLFASYRAGRDQSLRARYALSDPKWDNADGHDLRKFPNEGEQKVLVILVGFPDEKWSFSGDPKAEMTSILNKPGYNSDGFTGSAYDFFYESSNGIFRPEFDVYGPVTVSKSVQYYGERSGSQSDLHAAELICEACQLLDGEINFADYDRDGDGVVDNVYMFFAGPGENEGAESWRIWPHAWDVRYSSEPYLRLDGVQIGHYACSNELIRGTKRMAGIGTMCHEFSHVLGLPDLYATSYTGAQTPGNYSCMDQGPYLNNGRTPPLFSGYERFAVEWQKPVDITSGEQITMLPLAKHGNTYRMTLDPKRPNEYFIFENRQKGGFDTFIPHHGMLVWHINFEKSFWTSNIVNNTPTDQHVDIVEADGTGDDNSRQGDPFPGNNGVTFFNAEGKPAFANVDGTKSTLGLSQITESTDGTISFTVGGGRDENSTLTAPIPEMTLVEAGPDYFVIQPKDINAGEKKSEAEGEQTDRYMLSASTTVYDEDKDAFITTTTPGYEGLTFEGSEPLKISGLKTGGPYTVNIYRLGELNMSDPQRMTMSIAGDDMTATQPQISGGESNKFSWTKIAGADRYLLTVAKRTYADEAKSVEATFDNRRNPSGWESLGTFSSTAGTFGTSAPSLALSDAGDYIWSKEFTGRNIVGISLWASTNVTAGSASIRLYSANKLGALAHIATATVPAGGGELTFDAIPQGVTSFVIMSTVPAGKKVFIDDIAITTRDIVGDKPVGSYDNMEVEGNETQLSHDIKEGESYVAYVKAAKGNTVGKASNALDFVGTVVTGVTTIEADKIAFSVCDGMVIPGNTAEPYSVYMPDGRIVAYNVKGLLRLPVRGIYLIRSKSGEMKVIF